MGISIVFVALLVVAAFVVSIVTFLNDDAEPPSTTEPTTSAPRATPGPGEESTPSENEQTPPGGFVSLPAPDGVDANGFPVNYPHTPEGAAAYAAAASLATTTYDYAVAEVATESYLNPFTESERNLVDQAIANMREGNGVPIAGEVPVGNTIAYVFEGVRWEATSADEVSVWLSGTLKWNYPDGRAKELDVAGAFGVFEWKADRWWKVHRMPRGPVALTYHEPATQGFTRGGWRIIQDDNWKGTLP